MRREKKKKTRNLLPYKKKRFSILFCFVVAGTMSDRLLQPMTKTTVNVDRQGNKFRFHRII